MNLNPKTNGQPVITIGTITAIVSAIILLLTSFGLPISDGQKLAIDTFVGAVAPLFTLFSWFHVTPTVNLPKDVPVEPEGTTPKTPVVAS